MTASCSRRSLLRGSDWSVQWLWFLAFHAGGLWGPVVSAQPLEEPNAVYETPSPMEKAGFGAAAAAAGDIDGDGQTDLVVGAPQTDVEGVAEAGHVYRFSLP